VLCCLQVARRCYQLLLGHMTRFTYSPTGALKWKKDVSEYAEVLASYGVPAANEDMAYLQQVRDCFLMKAAGSLIICSRPHAHLSLAALQHWSRLWPTVWKYGSSLSDMTSN
jgi:hypothetical protein